MAKVKEVIFLVALVMHELTSESDGVMQDVVDNETNFLEITMKEELKLFLIQKSQFLLDNFPHELYAFFVLIKSPDHFDLLVYLLL